MNKYKYSTVGQNARRKIIENFDSKIVVQKYIKLYEEILANS